MEIGGNASFEVGTDGDSSANETGFTDQNLTTPHTGGPCPCDPGAWIEPQFRGDADPALGIRRAYGFAWQYVWQHDGADDDIVAYRVMEIPE